MFRRRFRSLYSVIVCRKSENVAWKMDSPPNCHPDSPDPSADQDSGSEMEPKPSSTVTENKFCIDSLLRPASTSSLTSPAIPPTSPNLRTLPLFPQGLYPSPGSGYPFNPTSDADGTPEGSPTTTTSSLDPFKGPGQGLNLQTMQLEWLARTGMLYHRFPELAGKPNRKLNTKLASQHENEFRG